jgi:hypothetical protein
LQRKAVYFYFYEGEKMQKVLLDYDASTGQIFDPRTNQAIAAWQGLSIHNEKVDTGTNAKVEKMIQLTNAGFDHDAVCEMVGKGLI